MVFAEKSIITTLKITSVPSTSLKIPYADYWTICDVTNHALKM